MNEEKTISDTTIEALARNFFKEANSYGFKYEHFLKFVNYLLGLSLSPIEKSTENNEKTPSVNLNITALPVKTERLIIRKFNKQSDYKMIKEWMDDEYGRYFLLSLSSNQSSSLDSVLFSESSSLGLITLKDNQPIGLLAYVNIDINSQKAELRKIIGVPNLRGKGFGKEATKAWIEYGNKVLGLRKIYLSTTDTNIRNIKINEDLGFKVEGILRNEIQIDNQFRDVLRMSLLFP